MIKKLGENQHNFWLGLRGIFAMLIKTDSKLLGIILLSTVAAKVALTATAYVAKLIVDYISSPEKHTVMPWQLLAIEVGLAIFAGVAQDYSNLKNQHLGLKTRFRLRVHAAELLASVQMWFFDSVEKMNRMDRLKQEVGLQPVLVTQAFASFFQGIVSMLSFSALIFSYSLPLGVFLLISILPAIFVVRNSSVGMFNLINNTTLDSRKATYFERLLTQRDYAAELRLFGLKDRFLGKMTHFAASTLSERLAFTNEKAISYSIAEVISTMVKYGVIAYTVHEAFAQTISIGDFTLFLTAILIVHSSLYQMVPNLETIVTGGLLYSNLETFKADVGTQQPQVGSGESLHVKTEIALELKNVSLKYPDSDKLAVKNVSLKIKSGESVVFVGKNGAGKSTLTKLLTGLYEPTNGEIFVFGRRLSCMSHRERLSHFSCLSQDFNNYHLSILEAVAIGNVDEPINEQRVRSLLESCELESFIGDCPEGLDTQLGKLFSSVGVEPSGGQWQKFALARALYRNAPILIADEPSSALDPDAELKVHEILNSAFASATRIMISHRLGAIHHADEIFVLEDGEVVERGSHTKLIKLRGHYFKLYSRQSQMYDKAST